jgi:hypothetical protein
MGYVRDIKTGKFSWVEGVGDDDDKPYVPPNARRGFELDSKQLLLTLLILGAVALVVMWGLNAFKDPSIAIRRIHNHPAEFDGRRVTLRGKVGEVFRVGGSYAYYLLQDRDTIVVYTHGPRPNPNSSLLVHGSVSIGYLDGAPRPAVFAE